MRIPGPGQGTKPHASRLRGGTAPCLSGQGYLLSAHRVAELSSVALSVDDLYRFEAEVLGQLETGHFRRYQMSSFCISTQHEWGGLRVRGHQPALPGGAWSAADTPTNPAMFRPVRLAEAASGADIRPGPLSPL